MEIRELQKYTFINAVNKGFYENPPSIPERLALIHSEVSEALEADRNGIYARAEIENIMNLPDETFSEGYADNIKGCIGEELADVVIRVVDLAEYKGIDLQGHIEAKMRYNSLREYKHGGKKY